MGEIIALGGGGFSMEPENSFLDSYVLKQVKKTTPKICFIPTASGDSDAYINKFYHAFNQLNCEPSHLSLFKPETKDIEGFLLSQDILYVGGGNTKNMLAIWKEWGVDRILKKAWESGVILAGISAGSICWFEEGVTDSYGDELHTIKCLGLLRGSNCPHYDGEEKRRPSYHNFIKKGEIQRGFAADDGVALHFKGDSLVSIVSSRRESKAYEVFSEGDLVVEEELKTSYLGDL